MVDSVEYAEDLACAGWTISKMTSPQWVLVGLEWKAKVKDVWQKVVDEARVL